MNYKNETIIYKKKNNKLYQVIEREVDLASLDDELQELANGKIKNESKIKEINDIKNLL